MADAEDYADQALGIVGGVGGGVVGALGGGSQGAKAVQDGIDAIRNIVGMATGSADRKRAEAAKLDEQRLQAEREIAKRKLDLQEREIALRER